MATITKPIPSVRGLPHLLARVTKKGPKFWRDTLAGYAMASPWLIGFLVFTAGPVLLSLYYSFTFFRITKPPNWIGLSNYEILILDDDRFLLSLFNTAYYVVGKVPLTIAVSLFVATLLNQPIRGRSVLRTIYYLPSIVSGVANAMLWLWIFNPRLGLINRFLALFGINGPSWIFSYEWAKPAMIIMGTWAMGGTMVIFLAGLQSVPESLLEAAQIDGANAWKRYWRVTVPLLTPTIFFNIITQIIGSFQIFVQVYIWTKRHDPSGGGAGPRNSLLFYVLYLFDRAFQEMRMGYASAMAWILFVIIMILTLIQFRLARRWVYYESGAEGGI